LSRLALIKGAAHHESMFGFILIAAIVLLAPIAYFAGAESRVDEVERRRRYSG
jgi:hypothetical protein